ncbi:SDR family oxidoreductase [Geomonas oryzisoli]|uniref:SDR family oxidoreductase n=1 Tax=Geomonas oryzisoli TaxID=2847992 RepID=A0ABX8JAD5_9BACT|nr:SDR family oxidoreductase [Geomonas oryzisoli]QWV93639.1 SDR family oxidoreductase [Geomonas oryzisoli]
MKIVVTGALGHIGSRLCREFAEAFPGAEVVMIDNLATLRYCSLFNLPSGARYRFVEADVLEADLAPHIAGADAVVHLAAITDAASSFEKEELVKKVNYNGTARVAKACSEAGAPLVYLSSTSVYGTQKELVDEECGKEELQPQSPYAESKLAEEALLRQLGGETGLDFVICRFGTIAGISPGMRFHTAVNKFCWQAVMGTPITVWTTALHQKRPYLALSDAVRALTMIIRDRIFDRGVYNVLTDNLTVNEIVEGIRAHVADLEITYVDTRIMNQLSYEVSNAKFARKGFQVTGSIATCIADTVGMLKNAGGHQ